MYGITQNMTIDVDRKKLIKTLKTKRKELADEFDKQIAALEQEIKDVPNTAQALKKWHIDVAERLANGTAIMRADGSVIPGPNDDDTVPEKPNTKSGRRRRHELEYALRCVKADQDQSLAMIDSSLRILELSTADAVPVQASEYNRLLSMRATRRLYY